MHFKQLKLIFEKYACCQICTSKLEISHNMLLRKGFSLSLKVKCIHCDNIDNFFTSPVVNNEKCGNKPHEVNIRSLMAFRAKFCTKGKSSWCKWQSDKVTKLNTYKSKVNLPEVIMSKLKPIFQELSKVEHLKKCLHGLTQNCNESFNQLIWNRCPKNIFV